MTGPARANRDGFRCLVFKDGDEVELASRNTKPLTRYFPELVAAAREQLPERCVLDGEIFVAVGKRLEFEVLQERIHPADSRVTMLSEKTPASFVAFDLRCTTAEGDAGRVASTPTTELFVRPRAGPCRA